MSNTLSTLTLAEALHALGCEAAKVRKASVSNRASCRHDGQDPFLQFCVNGNGARVQS